MLLVIWSCTALGYSMLLVIWSCTALVFFRMLLSAMQAFGCRCNCC
jgi:hypothetical protein